MSNFDIEENLKSVSTCFIRGSINYGEVDLAVCTTQGYLFEIYRKRVISSCYTGLNNVVDGCIYYDYHRNTKFSVYYVLRDENGDLIVVSKEDINLKVIERRSGIHSFRIADLENSGKPQLLIYSNANHYEHLLKADEEMVESLGDENVSVAQTMPKALQELRNQHDLLTKEIMFKKSLIQRRLNRNVLNSSLPIIGNTTDLDEITNPTDVKSPFLIIDTWERTCGDFWVTALHIKNSSDKQFGNLTVLSKSTAIDEYQWSVFQPGVVNALDSINSASSLLIIIAAVIPDLSTTIRIQNQFEIRYDDGVITSPEFQLTSKQVVSGDLELFHLGPIAQDLACVRLTHITCVLAISTAIAPAYSLPETLKTDLNLRNVIESDSSCFTSCNPRFSNLLIQFQDKNENNLKIKIFSRTRKELFLFINALKEIAPYGAKIDLVR